jgi:hypothetical protein
MFCLSSSVRSATLFDDVKKAWKSLKLVPDTHIAQDRWSEALSTPLAAILAPKDRAIAVLRGLVAADPL